MRDRTILQPGDTVNDLTIVSLHHSDHRSRRFLECRCICGKTKVIQASLITSGNTKSCGCRVLVSAKKRKKPNNQGIIHQIMLGYIRHSKSRGFDWSLSNDKFTELLSGACHYCGKSSSNLRKSKTCKEGFAHNGIDRVDSTLGYSNENCVSCCSMCNRAKLNHTKEEFLNWAERLSTYQNAMKTKAMAEQWG